MTKTTSDVSTFLSKSLFIRGRQCHKSLWLQKHRPKLKDVASDQKEALFETGYSVGRLAQKLFPGGFEVPYDGLSYGDQVRLTNSLIKDGSRTIYEATFLHDGIFVKVDILHREKRSWELFEVKASTEVKDYHYYDAALQYHAMHQAGIRPSRISIIHINTDYVRRGELNLRQLFTIEDVTSEVKELLPAVAEEIAQQRAMLAGRMPKIDIGPQCSAPFGCDFSGHCWSHIPEDSVFDIRGKGTDRFALYNRGIIRQRDIPLDLLNKNQRFQVESTLLKRDSIDRNGIREFLDSLWYPLCFLDFETFMDPIPPFDKARPYQQIPFQFSLHIQRKPGGEVEHYGFLGKPRTDPRPELATTLLPLLPKDGCVIAWNKSFEVGVLRDLADLLPANRKRIERIVTSFYDLMAPFRDRTVYMWQARGSYSVKDILPAMVPELTYEGLEIADGGAAMNAWHTMNSLEDDAELEKLRAALWEYCKLDTLAMVRILGKLRELCNRK